MADILEEMLMITRKSLNKEAISYLKSRGISKETAMKWEVGFLPSDQILLDLEGDREILYQRGILLRRVDKSPLDQYITFPMRDQYRRIVGFSGRPPLSNSEVKQRGLKKYWHSRFDKRKFLFGLDKAISSIRKEGYVIICEGQFDTITCSQAGIENIVSTCGTALTDEQIILLSRYTNKIYVVFDSDEAGRNAIEQLKKHQRSDLEFKAAHLPDSVDEHNNTLKEDPDSYIRKFGKEAFLKAILGEQYL